MLLLFLLASHLFCVCIQENKNNCIYMQNMILYILMGVKVIHVSVHQKFDCLQQFVLAFMFVFLQNIFWVKTPQNKKVIQTCTMGSCLLRFYTSAKFCICKGKSESRKRSWTKAKGRGLELRWIANLAQIYLAFPMARWMLAELQNQLFDYCLMVVWISHKHI